MWRLQAPCKLRKQPQRRMCVEGFFVQGDVRKTSFTPDRAAAERSAAFLCELRLSGRKLDEAAPCSWRRLRPLHSVSVIKALIEAIETGEIKPVIRSTPLRQALAPKEQSTGGAQRSKRLTLRGFA
jgi:hypothetical protein